MRLHLVICWHTWGIQHVSTPAIHLAAKLQRSRRNGWLSVLKRIIIFNPAHGVHSVAVLLRHTALIYFKLIHWTCCSGGLCLASSPCMLYPGHNSLLVAADTGYWSLDCPETLVNAYLLLNSSAACRTAVSADGIVC